MTKRKRRKGIPTTARFRVVGNLDGSVPRDGTVTIARASGIFGVRRLRSRRVYALPLSTVADMVVSKIIKAEVAEKRARRAR